MEHLTVRPASPTRVWFGRLLLFFVLFNFGFSIYAAALSDRPWISGAGQVMVSGGLVLGVSGSVLVGDRHPRIRWALLIGAVALLIASAVLLRRLSGR